MSNSSRFKGTADLAVWFWRGWRVALFLALTLAAFHFLWPSTPILDGPKSSYAHYYEGECDKAEARGWTVPNNTEQTKPNQWGGEQNGYQPPLIDPPDFCDMAAQYRSAAAAESSSIAAHNTFWWTVIGVIAVIGTLGCTIWAIRETREIGKKQTKAYLSVSFTDPKLTYSGEDEGIATFDVATQMIIANTGNSPAHSILVEIRLRSHHQPNKEFREFSNIPYEIAGGTHLKRQTYGRIDVGASNALSFNDAIVIEVRVHYWDVFKERTLIGGIYGLSGGNQAIREHITNGNPEVFTLAWE